MSVFQAARTSRFDPRQAKCEAGRTKRCSGLANKPVVFGKRFPRAADRRRSPSVERPEVEAFRCDYFLAKYRTSGKPLKSSSSVQTVAPCSRAAARMMLSAMGNE